MSDPQTPPQPPQGDSGNGQPDILTELTAKFDARFDELKASLGTGNRGQPSNPPTNAPSTPISEEDQELDFLDRKLKREERRLNLAERERQLQERIGTPASGVSGNPATGSGHTGTPIPKRKSATPQAKPPQTQGDTPPKQRRGLSRLWFGE